MTLNTDAIRAEIDMLYPLKDRPWEEDRLIPRRIRILCDEVDALNKARRADGEYFVNRITELEAALTAASARVKDRDNLRYRLDVATKDCAKLMSDLDCERRILHTVARENQNLKNAVFMLETRLKVEVVGLEVAHKKRAETRAKLMKAFEALHNELWPTCSTAAYNALQQLHAVVHNS